MRSQKDPVAVEMIPLPAIQKPILVVRERRVILDEDSPSGVERAALHIPAQQKRRRRL
jgi:hypothetical protein